MKSKFFTISVSLFVLIPLINRFAYGLIIALCLLFLMFFLTMIKIVIKKCRLYEFSSITLLACLVVCITLFIQLLGLYSAILLFTMRFSLYIAGLSYFVISGIFNPNDHIYVESGRISDLLIKNMKQTVLFASLLLLFCLLRDILGHGSISFPVPSGIRELILFTLPYEKSIGFFTTTGGAYILFGLCMALWLAIYQNIMIAMRTE